ncbi:DoxX family protein [Nocardioides speluncae]|uniref:DoxX family protein n=1 Tax=Nocardioides speluncae TaxID=2670337 RepID=UPI000D68A697|nr:DoxX family protein [Nocardioides speluncae]
MTTITAAPTTSTSTTSTKTKATKSQIAGRVVTVLVTAFLANDAVMHLINAEVVQNAQEKYGYPAWFDFVTGAVLVACLVLYVVPRTAVVGAVFLTGYLGGATAVNLSYNEPAFITMSIGTGVVVWLALWLRGDERVRAIYAPRSR